MWQLWEKSKGIFEFRNLKTINYGLTALGDGEVIATKGEPIETNRFWKFEDAGDSGFYVVNV